MDMADYLVDNRSYLVDVAGYLIDASSCLWLDAVWHTIISVKRYSMKLRASSLNDLRSFAVLSFLSANSNHPIFTN